MAASSFFSSTASHLLIFPFTLPPGHLSIHVAHPSSPLITQHPPPHLPTHRFIQLLPTGPHSLTPGSPHSLSYVFLSPRPICSASLRTLDRLQPHHCPGACALAKPWPDSGVPNDLHPPALPSLQFFARMPSVATSP